MDKFDQSITEANDTKAIEPTVHFVDRTMDKVKRLPKRAKVGWGIKAWGGSLAGLVAVLAVVFIIAPLTQNNSSQLNSNDASQTKSVPSGSSSTKTRSTTTTTPATSTATTPSSSSDSNTALNNDLNAVSSSISQENSDQSAANSGINDSSQEITVPTN